MPARDLPARPDLDQYKKQAKELLRAAKAGDDAALERLRAYAPARRESRSRSSAAKKLADAQLAIAREHGFESWPKFVDRIAVLNGREAIAEIWRAAETAVMAGDAAALERLLKDHGQMLRTQRPQTTWLGGLAPRYSSDNARAIVARNHSFKEWDDFAAFKALRDDPSSSVAMFETAVDAVVNGDEDTLERLLRQDPELVRARSMRSHHSTLLHYVGANGVEGFRQRTPKNAAQIAERLIRAGADVDATADMYGGSSTTLGLIVTSYHPNAAGVVEPLVDLMLAHGAKLDASGAGHEHALVNGCLANGRKAAAEYLVSRGAPLDLEGAAGVGRLDLVKNYFNDDGALKPTATDKQMKDGLAWACEYGRTDVAEFIYDRGIDLGELLVPNGQTGLHWAAYGGHVETVKALLKRGAPLDVKDRSFDGTPLGWALEGLRTGQGPREAFYEVIARLVAAGSHVNPAWQTDEAVQAQPALVAALRGQIPAP